MNIIQNLTLINFNKMINKVNKYIVIHYVGAVSTAQNNGIYFKNTYRGASAHYFVDDNEIVQIVKDNDRSWHCGDGLKNGKGGKWYNKCTNSNSIGIEMCCYMNNGKLDISEKTITNTIELVKELMAKYNIPVENVIRHFDVTNKVCPAPFVENESRWTDFKSRLGQPVPQPIQQPTELDYTGPITYQVYTNEWLEEVKKCDNTNEGFAGIGNKTITAFRCKPTYGEIIYQAHILGGNWLEEVNSKDYSANNGNSYAGIIGKPIDAIKIKSTKGYVDYRVKTAKRGWLPWVRQYGDYAGNFGEPIIGIQMK